MASSTEPSCDFFEFLARQRNLGATAAAELLGQWLHAYEPGELARAKGARLRLEALRRCRRR